MNARSLVLVTVIAAACFACGARTALDSGSSGGTSSDSLMIPLGPYPGCVVTTVTVGPHFEGVAGGDGALTLVDEGEGVLGVTLAFDLFATGTLAFTPTTSSSAAFADGESFDVDSVDFRGSHVTINATAGSLTLVGETLFLSIKGESAGAVVSGYVHCPVPARPNASVATRVLPSTSVTLGVYRSCTANIGSKAGGVLAGGTGTVTVTSSGGTLSATWDDALTSVCGRLDFEPASGSVTSLTPEQRCSIRQPCGPPPTLGPSTTPSEATLTNMEGSMTVDQHSLFINVVGDTSTATCGTHLFSIICASE
jgi:hypothetical protein